VLPGADAVNLAIAAAAAGDTLTLEAGARSG
jgi:hypothetical protein